MQRYEYKVVPAPKRGEKARGVKTTEDRFAFTLTQMMNDLGRDGWEYVRADTLPCDERAGLTGTKTTFQNMLVFRRVMADAVVTNAVADVAVVPDPVPAFTSLRAQPHAEAPMMKLGAAQMPAGAPRPLGPANHNVAAE